MKKNKLSSGAFWGVLMLLGLGLLAAQGHAAPQEEGNIGTTDFVFKAIRSGDTNSTTVVHYSTSDGTATQPSDYTAIEDATFTFARGQTEATIVVSVNGDTTVETDETFTLNVNYVSNGVTTTTTGTGTILNDDFNGAPTAIALNPNNISENNAPGATVGILTTADPNTGDSFTYELAGGADDASFTIVGDKLNARTAFDFETKNSYIIAVKSTDSGGLSVTRTLTVSVSNVNEAPVLTSNGGGATASVSIAENTTAVTTVTATDVDSTNFIYSLSGADAALFTLDATTHALRFKVAPDFEAPGDADGNNIYQVTIQVRDDGTPVASDTQALSVTVFNVNEAPVAGDGAASTDEDTSVSIDLRPFASDDGTSDNDLIYTAVAPSNGTLTASATGVYLYTPAANFNGTVTFTYTVKDSGTPALTSNPAGTITITINAVNDAPVATGQSATTLSSSPLAITLAATDVEGDNLTYSVIQPANGTVTVAGNVATYTSKIGYVGADSFTFRANDGAAFSNPATVNVTVKAGPTPPESGLVVTTLADVMATDGVTSLREAVDAANRDGINSAITFAVSGTITLTGGELTLVNDGKVSLTGPAMGITIVGDGMSRVLNIASGADATLVGMTITGGKADNGGAINNNSTLTLRNATLFGNASSGNGGAILNNGALTTINVTFVGNNASGNGGAIFNSVIATMTSLNSTIIGNTATAGGGLFKGKALNLSNSIVVGNTGDNLSGVADAGGNNTTSGTAATAGLDPSGLRDNGGAVKTIALTTRGTAVNAGDNALAAGLTNDGRGAGFPRIVSGKVDIGAFESAFGNRAPSLNNATFSTSVNIPFSMQLAGADPDGDTLSYARASGALPTGITLSRTGLLSGTPTVVGRYDFSVNAFDGIDTTVARFILILSANADGIGPVITRSALNASYTRDELAALVYRGQVRDVAPSGVTPSGVSQLTFQLRRDSDGFAYSGYENIGFTSNVNLGYFPAFLSEPVPNTTVGARDFRRTFGANGFVPPASVLTPGGYSLVIVAKDVAGNFSVEVVPFTITAATPSGSSAIHRSSDTSGSAS